jgi:hypothetical protein
MHRSGTKKAEVFKSDGFKSDDEALLANPQVSLCTKYRRFVTSRLQSLSATRLEAKN